MKSDSQICRDAAQIIRERGHAKGELKTNDGRLCLIGALYEVLGEQEERPPVLVTWPPYLAVRRVLADRWVSLWNDAPERTPEEVIAALETAADKLEPAQ